MVKPQRCWRPRKDTAAKMRVSVLALRTSPSKLGGTCNDAYSHSAFFLALTILKRPAHNDAHARIAWWQQVADGTKTLQPRGEPSWAQLGTSATRVVSGHRRSLRFQRCRLPPYATNRIGIWTVFSAVSHPLYSRHPEEVSIIRRSPSVTTAVRSAVVDQKVCPLEVKHFGPGGPHLATCATSRFTVSVRVPSNIHLSGSTKRRRTVLFLAICRFLVLE